jgi:hypothetical protein
MESTVPDRVRNEILALFQLQENFTFFLQESLTNKGIRAGRNFLKKPNFLYATHFINKWFARVYALHA